MPTMEEALSAAYDGAAGTPETPDPAPAAETLARAAESPDPETADPETPSPDPAPVTPTPPTTPETDAGPDVADLKAIKERLTADHPELQPVLDAALKEMQRGLQAKFQQAAAVKKAAEEALVRNRYAEQIPEADLVAMAQLNQLAQSNPQAAADYLFQLSENLRGQAQNPTVSANPYSQLPPQVAAELQQVRQYMHQQTQAQVIQQIEGQFAGLQPEFGGNPIPENQKVHVLETVQQRGLDISDIAMVWKGLYGSDYARQQGIKRGQALRQEKQSLSTGSPAAPPPAAAGSKPQSLDDALSAVCAAHGVR